MDAISVLPASNVLISQKFGCVSQFFVFSRFQFKVYLFLLYDLRRFQKLTPRPADYQAKLLLEITSRLFIYVFIY